MDLLKLALVCALAACYRPEARDCTISCSDPGDCVDGQVCGAGGWCAAPGVSCEATPDAAPPTVDGAEPVDAEPADAVSVDAAAAELRVLVSGRGRVVVEPLGVECEGTTGAPGDCTFGASPGTDVTLVPLETHPNYPFAAWTTDNCAAVSGACTVTIEPPTLVVGARFGT